ncbi:hypothetical protein HKX48_001404 [Thoreauomyces humboldtii]|nr:hypothetical protein HKX48_001404 [Thoreauomyces humboldtii]
MDIIKLLTQSEDDAAVGKVRRWFRAWRPGSRQKSIDSLAEGKAKGDATRDIDGKPVAVPVMTVPMTKQVSLTEVERGFGSTTAQRSSFSEKLPPKLGTITASVEISRTSSFNNDIPMVESPYGSAGAVFTPEETIISATASPRASVLKRRRSSVTRSASSPLLLGAGERHNSSGEIGLNPIAEVIHREEPAERRRPSVAGAGRSAMRGSPSFGNTAGVKRDGVSWGPHK